MNRRQFLSTLLASGIGLTIPRDILAALSFTSASSQYLINTSTPLVTAPPFSMACWFNSTTITARQCLMSLCNSGSNSNYFRLELAGDVGGDPVRAGTDGGAVASAATTAGYSANAWQHACGVWAATNSRAAYLNGANKGTHSSTQTPTGINRSGIGAQVASSIVVPMSGLIAEAAIWDVALSDEDVARLAKAISPLYVRPDRLVNYWPIIGRASPEIDRVGGLNMTLTNSPVNADHPRIYP